jgi:hypothetical protein
VLKTESGIARHGVAFLQGGDTRSLRAQGEQHRSPSTSGGVSPQPVHQRGLQLIEDITLWTNA